MLKQMQVDGWAGIKTFHIIVVSLSLLLTIFAWQLSKSQTDNKVALRFEVARDNTLGLILERMSKYEDALWGGVAAVESHGGDISYAQWHTYARTLRIEDKYPGINGIGIIHFHTAQTIGPYLAKQRLVRPDFDIFPKHDQSVYMPITFIEPESVNAAAIGLDVAHELNRRQAAFASADTGAAQITAPITLVQDEGATPGFLFYAPYYSAQGAKAETVEDRHARALGAVYAPFVVHKLMEGLLAKDLRSIRLSINDGDTVIYDEHGEVEQEYDPNPMFAEKVILELYGRKWVVDIKTNLEFRAANSANQSAFVLIGGLVIEALIIALFVMMAQANKRAVNYADRVTTDLRNETQQLDKVNKELSLKNEDIEQYAYVASHDLKTPLRGINGLTEMIEEDLAPYFTSSQANPEVKENLHMIRQRVQHMSHLTQGIMDFARVEGSPQIDDELDLDEVLSTLKFDLQLHDSQLSLKSDNPLVSVDVINLRRVLENLIGNAVKYHDGVLPMQITVEIHTENDRLHFTVSDNGPGIDPRFHEKVFEIFRSLSSTNTPENTGIGLSIVKRAIERNGGEISIKSELGSGASFLFDWPLGTDADKQKNQSRAA